jgi:hypothetical protein
MRLLNKLLPYIDGGTATRLLALLQDAAAMLPSIAVALLKPSTLVARPQQQQAAGSRYGYSRQKPIRTLHQQR